MSHDYSLLGVVLEGGSWADWFSGTMSFAAVAVALSGYWISNRQRDKDLLEGDKRAAERAWWRTVQALNHTHYVLGHLRDSLASDSHSAPPQFSFMRVRPLGLGNHTVSELAGDELNALIGAKAPDLITEISECVARYESIRYAMGEYKIRHEALFELLPTPISGDGTRYAHMLDADQKAKAMPYMIMLDTLLNDIQKLCEINVRQCEEILEKFPDAMKSRFGKWGLALEPLDHTAP